MQCLLIGKWFEAVHANQGKIRGEGKLKYQEKEHSGDMVRDRLFCHDLE